MHLSGCSGSVPHALLLVFLPLAEAVINLLCVLFISSSTSFIFAVLIAVVAGITSPLHLAARSLPLPQAGLAAAPGLPTALQDALK